MTKRDPKEQTALSANMWMPLLVKRIPGRADLPLPRYESEEAAGFDLRASFKDETIEYSLRPGGNVNIGCGFSFGIPVGFQLEIRPRSGLAFKHGVTIMNAPGTIDSDFTGEVVLMLARPMVPNYDDSWNKPDEAYHEWLTIKHGTRIAQAILMPIFKAHFNEVDELPTTKRGDAGLGSTGVN